MIGEYPHSDDPKKMSTSNMKERKQRNRPNMIKFVCKNCETVFFMLMI